VFDEKSRAIPDPVQSERRLFDGTAQFELDPALLRNGAKATLLRLMMLNAQGT